MYFDLNPVKHASRKNSFKEEKKSALKETKE